MIFRTRRVQPRPPVQQGFLKIKLFQSRSYPRSRNGTSDNSGFFCVFSVLAGHAMSDIPSSKLLFYSQQGPDNQMDLISEEEQVVTRSERNNWIINIENTLDAIESQLDPAVIDSVFNRYGARNVWDLNPSDLPDVFSELYAIKVDLD